MRIQTVFTLICSLFLFIQTLGTTHESLASSLAATIELDRAVHFVALNGDDVVVPSGAYSIDVAEEWQRLTSGEARDAPLLQTRRSSHDKHVEEPVALSIPSDQDLHHIVVLLPDGKSFMVHGRMDKGIPVKEKSFQYE